MLKALAADLRHALDPVTFARERLGFEPDPWQADVLRSTDRNVLLNCSRQAGKSTTISIIALHTACYQPHSLVLLGSPSLRQSRELFIKVVDFLRRLEPRPALDEDNRLSFQLGNGSRVVSLPGTGETVRGFSAPDLIIEDEGAFVQDSFYWAVRPMLAVSGGRLILMSTPYGKRGHFTKHGDRAATGTASKYPQPSAPGSRPRSLKPSAAPSASFGIGKSIVANSPT